MSGLSKEFLEQIGVRLDQATFNELSKHFDTTLYNSVVSRIVGSLESEQLNQLTAIHKSDKDYVWNWLLDNVADLDLIIKEEIYMLIGDVIENADHL